MMNFKAVSPEQKQEMVENETQLHAKEKEIAKSMRTAKEEKAKTIADSWGLVWPRPPPPHEGRRANSMSREVVKLLV